MNNRLVGFYHRVVGRSGVNYNLHRVRLSRDFRLIFGGDDF